MARLFADENFPLPVVEALRQSGHDILAVLSFARADNRAVLTLNRKHFVRLHNAQVQHSGIIVCTFDPDLKDKLAAFIRPLKLRHNCWNNSFA
jgi:hypothetical protein